MTATVDEAADVVAVVPIRSDSTATSLTISGRSVLGVTIQALQAVPRIRAIAVALDGPPPEGLVAAIDMRGGRPVLTTLPVTGRWAAILAALEVAGESETVLVHDPDRPLVSPADISQLLDRSRDAGAVVVAVPVVSSMKRVVDGSVTATVPRDSLYVQQGLWVFGRRLLARALRSAVIEDWDAANELALAHQAGISIQIADGRPLNVPIVSPADARFAEMAIERGLASPSGPPAWSA
ncbi:MAG TPA: 2-C-methyl-D-erythritol 4-phosphate cytidylyltransferase [Candidatus Eisenbacteria bacterium]|nr:2-C-methyl-D-erythritol 4-phosphate cytidylyltransferase [Candidatus Eisenbacteria bacterium]